MKVLLFLREVDEQIEHLELLSTIFFGVRSIGNLWDVWQYLAKEARETDINDNLLIRDWFQS